MGSLGLNVVRLAVAACAAAGGAMAAGQLDASFLLQNQAAAGAAGGALVLVWIVAEVMARRAQPPQKPASRVAPAADPELAEFLLRVQKHAASEQFAQLAKELPAPAALESLLQRAGQAERPRLLVSVARAHEAIEDYAAAILRAKQARALKPDSRSACEVLCRAVVASPPANVRLEDYHPAFKELATAWKEEYAPLVLHVLRAALDRPQMTHRVVTQVWELAQAFRKIDDVVGPFVAAVQDAVAKAPQKADLLAVVARLRASLGNAAAAQEVCWQAVSKTRDCPSVYRVLLELHQAAGKLGELTVRLQQLAAGGNPAPALQAARQECEKAIQATTARNKGAGATPLELGIAHLSSGDYANAIASLQKAIYSAPVDQGSFLRFLLARSFLKGGQAPQALEQLERTDPEALTLDQRYDLATDLEAAGQLQQARKQFAAIAAIDHAYKDVAACLARIDGKTASDPQTMFEQGLAASLPKRFNSPRLAGQGGMGLVYRAFDAQTDRPVAIKVLSPLLANEEDQKRRFLREATTLGELDHPGIVKIVDVGEKPLPYYAMEFLAGTTLGSYLKGSGPMDGVSAAILCGRIAESLGYCHDKGLIHRDIKPDNIFLEETGRVVLIDFGLVHVDARTALTKTGAVMGTLAYMSPEQLAARPVTPATDIYALGVTLFEMVTGRLPFEGQDVIGLVMTQPPPAPRSLVPSLSETLNATILKCLEKLPSRRHKSCAELERALASG